MLVASFNKQPAEVLRRTIDYSCRFDSAHTILNIDTNIELLSSGVSSLTVSTYILPGATSFEYFTSGGLDGEGYKVTFTSEISDTQVLEDEVECYIEDT